VGAWHNTDTGNIYLDVSVVHPNKQAALDLASKNKQLSIFDLARKEEISVKNKN
jgi:hypothetical protein